MSTQETSASAFPDQWDFPEKGLRNVNIYSWDTTTRSVKGSTGKYDFEYVFSQSGNPVELRRKNAERVDIIVAKPDPQNPFNVCYTFLKDAGQGNASGLQIRYINRLQFNPAESEQTFGSALYHTETGLLQAICSGELFSPENEEEGSQVEFSRSIVDGKPEKFHTTFARNTAEYFWTYNYTPHNFFLQIQQNATRFLKILSAPTSYSYDDITLAAFEDIKSGDRRQTWRNVPQLIRSDLKFQAVSYFIKDVSALKGDIVVPNASPTLPDTTAATDRVIGRVRQRGIFPPLAFEDKIKTDD